MSGVVGGVGYGNNYGGGGGGKYDSYNNKSYNEKGSGKNYGGGMDNNYGGMGVYGDYTYSKSTLDKYKNNEKTQNKSVNITGSTGPSIVPDITGGAATTPQ